MPADVLEALRLLRRSLSRAAIATFATSGVGPRQVAVLRELRRVGSSTQVDLSRAMSTDPAAMMRALDALERRGWVLRACAENDCRCKNVSLTPKGRRALGDSDLGYEALRSVTNGALTTRERKLFCDMAAKMAVTLQTVGAAPGPDDS